MNTRSMKGSVTVSAMGALIGEQAIDSNSDIKLEFDFGLAKGSVSHTQTSVSRVIICAFKSNSLLLWCTLFLMNVEFVFHLDVGQVELRLRDRTLAARGNFEARFEGSSSSEWTNLVTFE